MSELDQSSMSNSVFPSLMRLKLRKKNQRSQKEELSGWNNGNSPTDENDCFFLYQDQHQSNQVSQPQNRSHQVVNTFDSQELKTKSKNTSVYTQSMDFSSFQTEGVYRKVETLGELHENLLDQKKRQLLRTRGQIECQQTILTNKQKPEYVSEQCFVMKIKGKSDDTCPVQLNDKKFNENKYNDIWSNHNTQQDLRYPCENNNSEQVDAIQELKQISGFLSSPKKSQQNNQINNIGDRTNQLPIFINRRTPLVQIISKSRASTPFQNNDTTNKQQTQPVPWRISLNKVRYDEEAYNNNKTFLENNKYLNFSTEFTSKDMEDTKENEQNDQRVVEIDDEHHFKKKLPLNNNENIPSRQSQIYFSRNTSVTPSQSRKQSMENSHMIPAFLPRVVRNSIGANKHLGYLRDSQNLVKNTHKDRLEDNTGQTTAEGKQTQPINTNIYLKHIGNFNTVIKRRSCSSISKLKPPLDEKSSQRTIKCVNQFDVEDQENINQQGRGQLENKFRTALSQYFSNDCTKPNAFKLIKSENNSQGEQLNVGIISKPPKDSNIRSQKKRSSLHSIIMNSPKNKKKNEDLKEQSQKNKEVLSRLGVKQTTRSSSAQPSNKQAPQFIICQRVTVEQISKTLKRESLESEGSVSYNGKAQK